jgi:maltose alpha-D-glucosyltransferase / alpha-amylase
MGNPEVSPDREPGGDFSPAGIDPALRTPNPAPWFAEAVFYLLPVRSFFDGNGDGVGDFSGLTAKLDHIVELGATCVWLLPFYPSPMADDGYDVADYRDVHPDLGTMADFRAFATAAKARGLRVAAEMVVNHTSDQHPWFQAARAAPPGSPVRDFYVWSDTPDRYREVSIHYADAEASNWSWDAAAGAYFWHRFFRCQPELNYDNPRVREEVTRVLRFWLDAGVDALCLNGAAYLAERDGTRCEHLPETHSVLKRVRREVSGAYPGAVLQAGVNARPDEAAAYFGGGDECQLVPNLPLAQRLFLAVGREDRYPIADLLRRTPEPPPGCQWVTLLRNHDELTLSPTTDEEQDDLFRAYAADPSTRRHAGILRRLAPLADNSRPRIELLFGLLFSLPGAPVVYYGDEIGMGDNPRLSGRTGVRTPMPWTGDRNAGFSAADPATLPAPPVADPVYGYQAVNVAAQRRDRSSLFHAVRRLIGLRRRSPALARGRLELLEPGNPKVFAFLRRLDGETVLVVANLARTPQPASVDLSGFAGLFPVEVSGQTPFSRIGEGPYPFTLAPHACHWFELRKSPDNVAARFPTVPTAEVVTPPVLELPGGWQALFDGPARETLESVVFPTFLRSQRWFGGKARAVETVRVIDWGALPGTAFTTFLDVGFEGGARALYFLPVAVVDGVPDDARHLVIAKLKGPGGDGLLCDALADATTCDALLDAVGQGVEFPTRCGRLQVSATAAFFGLRGEPSPTLPASLGPATSSNSLVFYGRRLLLKLYRRLEPGTNPDLEVGRFLTEKDRFPRTPAVAGSLIYRPSGHDESVTLGILQALVPNQGDGWGHAIGELNRYYDRAAARMDGPDLLSPDPRPLADLVPADPPPAVLETIRAYLHAAATLGRRTAEMHSALASDPSDPTFAPEPLTKGDMSSLSDEIVGQQRAAFSALQAGLGRLQPEVAAYARRLLGIGPTTLARLVTNLHPPAAAKTRVHGDYHLGQVLWAGSDYVIIDFEGEPTRSLSERRAKFSPVRDVAGMVRSFHYAAYAGLFAYTRARPDDFPRLEPWAESWYQWASAAFLRSYLAAADGAVFLPRRREEFSALLDRFMLAKALYELGYELNNRPDWVRIPLRGVLALLR